MQEFFSTLVHDIPFAIKLPNLFLDFHAHYRSFIAKLSSFFDVSALWINGSAVAKLKNRCGYSKIIHHISLKCKKFLKLSILYIIDNEVVKFFSYTR